MRRLSLLGVAMVCVPVMAQTHVVKKPDSVVRAVGVYEWTGEPGKATASRLVPVSVFINGKLEDAGIYLARPVPFALQTGNIFELEKAGVDEGSLELAYQRHLVSQGNGSFDDGWMAVGAYKAKPAEKFAALKAGPVSKVEVSGGSGPHFSQKPGTRMRRRQSRWIGVRRLPGVRLWLQETARTRWGMAIVRRMMWIVRR